MPRLIVRESRPSPTAYSMIRPSEISERTLILPMWKDRLILKEFRRLALLAVAAVVLVACGGEGAVPIPDVTTQPRAGMGQAGANPTVAPATSVPISTLVPTHPLESAGAPAAPRDSVAGAQRDTAPAGPTVTETPAPPENTAHSFVLPSAPRGDLVSLESYAGRKNVVLVFYRGFW